MTKKQLNLIKLKIKSKHLALEPAIIKAEERKLKEGKERTDLYKHRVIDVRREARATNLAIGYLKGLSYRQLEPTSKVSYDRSCAISRASKIAFKYSGEPGSFYTFKSDFFNWAYQR